MKIYTKTGDTGTTALFGGTRVAKHDIRVDAYGSVDELNAWIGLLKDQPIDPAYQSVLLKIQHDLFSVGTVLATDPEKATLKNGKKRTDIAITIEDITFLETQIDTMEQSLAPMTHFILPGGHQTVSYCHITRCVCRRAERLATQLYDKCAFSTLVLGYLNRLSDYLFVLARKLTLDLKGKEIPWIPKTV